MVEISLSGSGEGPGWETSRPTLQRTLQGGREDERQRAGSKLREIPATEKKSCKPPGFSPQWNIATLKAGSRGVPHWYETSAESARLCAYPAVHCRFAGALGVAHAN